MEENTESVISGIAANWKEPNFLVKSVTCFANGGAMFMSRPQIPAKVIEDFLDFPHTFWKNLVA